MKNIGIFKAMKLCRDYEKSSTEEKQVIRNQRLKKIVEHARKNSPYYNNLYLSVPESFTLMDLPTTNKKTLMANWNDWICDPDLTLEEADKFMENPDNIGRKLKNKYLGNL